MGALKPRQGFGELDVCREARRVVIRIPTDARTERVVFTLDEGEARELACELARATANYGGISTMDAFERGDH